MKLKKVQGYWAVVPSDPHAYTRMCSCFTRALILYIKNLVWSAADRVRARVKGSTKDDNEQTEL